MLLYEHHFLSLPPIPYRAGAAAADDPVAALAKDNAAYLQEALGGPLLPASARPASAVVLETEKVEVGSADIGCQMEFTAVLTTAAVSVVQVGV